MFNEINNAGSCQVVSFESFVANYILGSLQEQQATGLLPILGLPRSGKTTLLKNIVSKYNTQYEHESIFLKADEFDSGNMISTMIRSDDLLNEIIENCVIHHLVHDGHRNIMVVDSIKSLFYHSNGGLRIGGISNDSYVYLNFINMLAKEYNILIIASLSTTSLNKAYVDELMSIIAGSSEFLALISSSHQVIHDEGSRSSINDLSTLWLTSEGQRF